MNIDGVAVSQGIAMGHAHLLNKQIIKADYQSICTDVTAEVAIFHQTRLKLINHLQQLSDSSDINDTATELIEADILLLEDDEFISEVEQLINQWQFSTTAAVERCLRLHAHLISQLNNQYLASRANDIESLSQRLIALFLNVETGFGQQISHEVVLFADDITPAEFSQLPLQHIKALVLKSTGVTSHTAILARAHGIPALFLCDYHHQVIEGDAVVVDALAGKLYINPDNNRQQQLADSGKAAQLAQQKLRQFINLPAQTLDGHSVKLLSNIGQLNQLAQIEQLGIDGIGLLRTELLFMGLKQAPTEEQQYEMYKQTVEAVTPKVVTIRTLDVGADKQLDYIHLDKQENPALGERGVRYSLHNPEQFMVQLRAILRASTLGCIRVMFPMINQVEELIDILDLLAQSKKQLKQQQLDYGKIELGIVVETPAAIINLPSMLPYLDFISIGSNDLSQYTLAVDRTNPVLSQQFSAFSPAIIQSIATVINLAKQQQISVSLCGELASDPRIAPILIGLGLDELSINIGTFLPVKAAICSGQYKQFTQQAAACLKSTKISQLAQYL